jgi:outer membrane protein
MNRLISLALSLVLVSVLSAQTVSVKTMTLQQAINAALQNNSTITMAQNNLTRYQAGVTVAYGQFLPTVNGLVGWNGSHRTPPLESGSNTSALAKVDANVTLFNGFSNIAGLSRSRDAARSTEQDLYRMRQTIVLSTQQGYLQVLRNKSLLAICQENLKKSNQQLDRIVESNKVGAVAIGDVYKQQATTANDELTVIQAQSAYDNSKTELLYLVALDVTQEYDFVDESIANEIGKIESADAAQQTLDANQLMTQALIDRPDYQSLVLQKSSMENGVTIARSGYMPVLSGNVGYVLANTSFSNISDVKTWSYGLTLNIPIFNGFQTSTNVQIAELFLDDADKALDQGRRLVQKDLKQAVLNLESARKQVEVSQKGVVAFLQDRKTAEEKYSLGAGTLLDLLIANAAYVTAENGKVNAEYDYLYCQQQLKLAIGKDRY